MRKRYHAIVDRIPTDRLIVGAEIGVLYGATSAFILGNRENVTHIMVDPWSDDFDESYRASGDDVVKQPPDFFDRAYKIAIAKVEPYKDRVIVLRKKSVDAARCSCFRKDAPHCGDRFYDYVFIDADHSYEGVQRDIAAWLPKIRAGGWIGGHDYNHIFPGVDKAVREAFPLDRIETDVDHTWFVRIPE